ncbi:MAG: rhodanese-like domain-containing protein [Rhodospirillales bacterium]|nr:rhodanese-like domain-containing protein [Rhodospirillales bacterium]MBI3113267.1 rhodanese-like domain-containing protein [Rhodospirillales bacterium]
MPGMSEVPPATVHQWLEAGEAVAVDVREADELAQARLKDFVHVPMSAFDPALIPTDGTKKVVFVCARGQRSEQIGHYIVGAGILPEAYNMSGGLIAWHQAGLPLEFGTPTT